MGYHEEQMKAGQELAREVSGLSVRNLLRAQRQELEARIHKIDALLQILEKNPDFEKMFELTRELI